MAIETIVVATASVIVGVLAFQFVVLPLTFRYSKFVQRKILFSNCVNYPRNVDYDNPSCCNVLGARNFNVEFTSTVDECHIKLGTWHLVPRVLFKDVFILGEDELESKMADQLKNATNTVVLYCHGNSNHRGSLHRSQMYKVFQDMNFHVITFDYRGYGDSTNARPTERGVVEDALQMYLWLNRAIHPDIRPTILLWGHSIGSAVVANLVASLERFSQELNIKPLPQPDAVVLESPFNNLKEEIESHLFSKVVSRLPYYKDIFMKPFSWPSDYSFTTDQYLQAVPDVPVLMLHAKGDRIVPYDLAVKLYDTVVESREGINSGAVHLHTFGKGKGLGHNNLCQAEELKEVVQNFLKNIKRRKINTF